MYILKMNKDKSFTTTQRTTIFKGERNADTLVFLLPKEYNGKDLSASVVHIQYTFPNGDIKVEQLQVKEELYKGYLMYSLGVNSQFTESSGRIWLNITCADTENDFLLETKTTVVEIMETTGGYITSEEQSNNVEVNSSDMRFIDF